MSSAHTLPPDLLETQISTLDLLLAMFPDAEEVEISPSDIDLLNSLRDSDGSLPTPPEIPFALHVTLDDGSYSIQVNCTVPLRSPESNPLEPPPFTFSIRQPTWLGREKANALSSLLPDDIFSALEVLREEGVKLIPSSTAPSATNGKTASAGPLIRVWFYFPSLSTREKRSDMVRWAPSYHLTGFVLAGKPGMLCLEGNASDIDSYMNEIKTVSWSDIPSHQKKVSERYRETEAVTRAFEVMQEITDKVGERHGARANRGDMAALESWLKEKGLGEAFSSVIMQS